MVGELGLGIFVVTLADGSLNRIELKQVSRGLPSTATRIGNADLAAVAAGMGCDATRIAITAGLEKALSPRET